MTATERLRMILNSIDENARAAYPKASTLEPLHDQLLAIINGVEFARRTLAELDA